MKTVRNLTRRPLRIPLPGGRALHIGPGKTAQVSDKAVEMASLKNLVSSGEIEVLSAEGHPWTGGGPEGAGHVATRGQHHEKSSLPKGNR